MANPRPTPTKLRLLTGDTSKGKSKINHREPTPAPGIPERPPLRDAVARKEWDRVAKLLHEMGVLSKADGICLALYADTYSVYKEAELQCRKKGLSVGGLNKNPHVAIMQTARTDMLRFLQEFGLTPASRPKVQVFAPNDAAAEFFGG